jgi:outer membrane lipoprotein
MGIRSILFAAIMITLSGCAATHVPVEIRETPERDPGVDQVRSNIDSYKGVPVRWGGTIASVENKEQETWIEVVAARLDSSGRPRSLDASEGRFLVRIDGFLDPQIYAMHRELTVFGEVEDLVEQPIGEHAYIYPLMRAQTYYLWPEYQERRYGHYPYPYPYYYPAYPYSYRFYRPYYYRPYYPYW